MNSNGLGNIKLVTLEVAPKNWKHVAAQVVPDAPEAVAMSLAGDIVRERGYDRGVEQRFGVAYAAIPSCRPYSTDSDISVKLYAL